MTLGQATPHDIFSDATRWVDIDAWNHSALDLHDIGGIHRIERDGFAPFWAVIDHAAVLEIERQPELFTNEPEVVLTSDAEIAARDFDLKTLVHVDDPLHDQLRRLTVDWFKPASVRRLDSRLAELSAEALGKLRSFGGNCDFAVDIALPFPLQVILRILGLPESDYPRMLTLTQELFGSEDPDLRREGDDEFADLNEVVADFFGYFGELTAERRANPGEDLASLIANGQIDDEPLGDLETLGYYVIVATAGHDTTSSAMSGGMHALVERQDQLRRLQAEPELLNNAVEEMVRWTAPVRHFMRTAQSDTEILGQEIKAGDWMYLSYKAANLDPKVFDDPLIFDIARPNADRNVSFGYGVHFCLGAQLARNELRHLFGRIVPEIETIELAGPASMAKTTFVGGHKSLPIQYTLTAPS